MDKCKTTTLTPEGKFHAVPLVLFLTEKRCGKIKMRKCANGQKRHEHKSKEEATSTAYLDSVMMTGVIETKENHDVVAIDLSCAFLHANITVMEEKLAKRMAMAGPKIYRKYVATNSKRKKCYTSNYEKHCIVC